MAERQAQLLQPEESAREKQIEEALRRQDKRRRDEARKTGKDGPRGDLKSLLGLGLRFLTR